MKPFLKLAVPFVEHFHALLLFMHTQDECQLSVHLRKIWSQGTLAGQQGLQDFAANMRHLGFVNHRIRHCAEHVMLQDNTALLKTGR